jgi:two-component system LytT family response regulator
VTDEHTAPPVVRALICEDEPLARRAIREYVKDVEWIDVVGEAPDGPTALRLIHKHEPDLVFMDVRMPGLTGLQVLDAVTHRAAVVFTTAYDEYAVQAFEHGAVDYLVKPFGRDRLLETLDRVRVRLIGEGGLSGASATVPSARYATRLFGRQGGGIVPVLTGAVIRIEAADAGVALVTATGAVMLDSTLGEVAQRLDPLDFVRIHRSHIVNLRHVVEIRPYDDRRLSVRLADETTVVASRDGSRLLKSVMS